MPSGPRPGERPRRYNQPSRAINNTPFQSSDGRDSPQRRRGSAARVKQGILSCSKFTLAHARSSLFISGRRRTSITDAPVTSWGASRHDSFHEVTIHPVRQAPSIDSSSRLFADSFKSTSESDSGWTPGQAARGGLASARATTNLPVIWKPGRAGAA